MADERDVRCITCGAVINSRLVTIVTREKEEEPRIWIVPVYVCTKEACMERAGGIWRSHRENRSGRG